MFSSKCAHIHTQTQTTSTKFLFRCFVFGFISCLEATTHQQFVTKDTFSITVPIWILFSPDNLLSDKPFAEFVWGPDTAKVCKKSRAVSCLMKSRCTETKQKVSCKDDILRDKILVVLWPMWLTYSHGVRGKRLKGYEFTRRLCVSGLVQWVMCVTDKSAKLSKQKAYEMISLSVKTSTVSQ